MTDTASPTLSPGRIAEVLTSDIIVGRIAPNSRMIEDDVAARFNVSRSPVRDAIRLLEQEGLVVKTERRGARVAAMNRRDLNEVYLCRLSLEAIAASEAAKNIRPPAQRLLDRALVELKKAFERSDVARYFEANVAFTGAIHIAADNATLRRLLNGIDKQSLRYRFFAYRNFPQLMGTSLEGSRAIAEAIRRGNSEEAHRVTQDLIRKSWDVLKLCIPE
ncbi:GntR family transcriptional regulator [Bosea sp. (in: a-proteobacteria)]|uniref:GntR family transcriptional regulator n=1 Tax=Bosea sp. (in: a-proteobacteria) TaxID=1871050 RepID=UPI0026055A6A|nr:GntR family transcriptional regulator [Bosea sp. (in: a-proteobacteria)]MCO5089525.1 GntR family transcriptional regulator [Bosea sp. (in: a-proteobacteria)]